MLSKSYIYFFITCASISSVSNAAEFKVGDVKFNPYARIVAGLDYTTNLFEAGVSGDRSQVSSNQWGTSYIGMNLQVPVSDGWIGVANLESGFGTERGQNNSPDTFFDRKANAGLSHQALGQITAGTHLSIAQDISSFDPMGFQVYGVNSLVNGVNDGSTNNSVLYRSPNLYGVELGYIHEFGGYVDDNKRGSGNGVSLSYTYDDLKLIGIYLDRKDSFGRYTGGDYYGLGSQGQWKYAKNYTFAASYDFEILDIFAGYEKVEAPDSGFGKAVPFDDEARMIWGGANFNVTPNTTILAGVYNLEMEFSKKKSTLYSAGVNHKLSDNLMLYWSAGYINNNKVDPSLVGAVGGNNHALSYDDVACSDANDCNGASQFGSYLGVVVNI